MPVPYTFGSATSAIPLSQLDSNFNTTITLGNTAIQLGNTVTTLNNMTLANVTISSGSVTLSSVTVTNANVTSALTLSGLTASTALALDASKNVVSVTNTGTGNNVLASSPTLTTPNLGTPSAVTLTNATGLPLSTGVTGTLGTTNGGTGLTSFTANGVVYASSTSALATGSSFVFDGTNVGIGTSSPGTRLHTNAASPTRGIVNLVSATGSTGVQIQMTQGGVDDWAFGQPAGTSAFAFWSGRATGADGTERMRIDSSGNLLVGTTSVPNGTSAWGVGFEPGGNSRVIFKTGVNTTSTASLVAFYNPNGLIGTIQTSGSATSYNTSSDYRLKNITGPITNSGAYIDSLNPVEGTWKADGSTFVGLIAHEVQEVSRTQVATGEKDGAEMQGMDYSSAEIIANLIAEVKSLRARMAQLEAKG